MKSPIGATVSFQRRLPLRVEGEIARGGEGIAFRALEVATGKKKVVKQYFHRSDSETRAREARLVWLIAMRLGGHRLIVLPTAVRVHPDFGLLELSEYAEGETLDELAENGWVPDFASLLQLAWAIAIAYEWIHGCGLAHGDVGNLLIHRRGDGVLAPTLIDFSNYFMEGGMPAPQPCIGQELNIAFEQRVARAAGQPGLAPDLLTERAMLASLLQQIVLLRHPAHETLTDPRVFDAAMSTGCWADDVMNTRDRSSDPGYPIDVLSEQLKNLFRRSFRADRESRPAPSEWVAALRDASEHLGICPRCSGPAIQGTQMQCPYCKRPYPALRIRKADGSALDLRGTGLRLGRSQFGGSMTISEHHLTIAREGPIVWMTPHGRNGTSRLTAGGREALPAGVPVSCAAGDQFEIAGTTRIALEWVG